MAGITFLVKKDNSKNAIARVERILGFEIPVPTTTSLITECGEGNAAFAAKYPKHYRRERCVSRSKHGTVLFYGELYNDGAFGTEAEYVSSFIDFHGIDQIHRLDGPFAFIYWDDTQGCAIAATDRLGRMPLFYIDLPDSLIVTNDLHQLFTSREVSLHLSDAAVADFLTIGFVTGSRSIFEGVERVAAGEYLICSNRPVKRTYWIPQYSNGVHDIEPMVSLFAERTQHAIRRRPHGVVALSGGWDSRATVASLYPSKEAKTLMTFGVPGSTDVNIASTIAETLHQPHIIIHPESDFFGTFDALARKAIRLGNGHTTVDMAFQLYSFERLAMNYTTIVDSAGCEFRRGIRALLAAQGSHDTQGIVKYLTTMYSTGIWNDTIVQPDFYHHFRSSTHDRLTEIVSRSPIRSPEGEIDWFSWTELWSHHYAFGYPLQTSIIACDMPYSDNPFYDLFLRSDHAIRWSYKFHTHVIDSYCPILKTIPISYGGIRVPFGDSPRRYLPMIYHRLVGKASGIPGCGWMHRFDNYRPFRPYHVWYDRQLRYIVDRMFESSTFRGQRYIDIDNLYRFINGTRNPANDRSFSITILLTLAYLLDYVREMNNGR